MSPMRWRARQCAAAAATTTAGATASEVSVIFVCPEPLDHAGEAELHRPTINPLAHVPIARRLPSVSHRLTATLPRSLLPGHLAYRAGAADPPNQPAFSP